MIGLNVAIVGASGIVGHQLLSILEERSFPIASLVLMSSERSVGQHINFAGKNIALHLLDETLFRDIHIAFFMAGGEISKKWVPIAVAAGARVIDNSSYYRIHKNVPLILVGVNDKILETSDSMIISNPNCSTAILLMALAPLHHAFGGLKHILVSTYQSVSGAGKSGIKALERERQGLSYDASPFSVPIDANVIPHIDDFLPDGHTKEEHKMIVETHKILGDTTILFDVLCVRVPVWIGHAMTVFVETHHHCPLKEVRKVLEASKEIIVQNESVGGGYATPSKCAGSDFTYVSRLCQNLDVALSLFVVGDNVRKGAALNSVQIGEKLIERVKQ